MAHVLILLILRTFGPTEAVISIRPESQTWILCSTLASMDVLTSFVCTARVACGSISRNDNHRMKQASLAS
ncbi:hypothetical protein BDV28DRAFT_93337 [Aspergillus coremiiformis]|uniref:Secreted protein n=1 Tax=Aspergillus coremiiformis TaxID=138285 RepID=A0A5N6Z8S3_9EURO|nr:hypothetical protein BDV28DRAFT_93337 [Aspergillus coremiiformis]